jgi:hypothetical protein
MGGHRKRWMIWSLRLEWVPVLYTTVPGTGTGILLVLLVLYWVGCSLTSAGSDPEYSLFHNANDFKGLFMVF